VRLRSHALDPRFTLAGLCLSLPPAGLLCMEWRSFCRLRWTPFSLQCPQSKNASPHRHTQSTSRVCFPVQCGMPLRAARPIAFRMPEQSHSLTFERSSVHKQPPKHARQAARLNSAFYGALRKPFWDSAIAQIAARTNPITVPAPSRGDRGSSPWSSASAGRHNRCSPDALTHPFALFAPGFPCPHQASNMDALAMKDQILSLLRWSVVVVLGVAWGYWANVLACWLERGCQWFLLGAALFMVDAAKAGLREL